VRRSIVIQSRGNVIYRVTACGGIALRSVTGRGLAPPESESGTLLVYPAKEAEVTADQPR
jgi:hypothetical protein